MKHYKIQNVLTGEYLTRSKVWTKKGSVWQYIPIEAIERCLKDKIEINLLTYKLTLLEIKAVK